MIAVHPPTAGRTDGTATDVADRPADRLVPARRRLALHAARYSRLRRRATPAPWLHPGFATRVETVLRDLAPLCDRRLLAASFEREAALRVPFADDHDVDLGSSPTLVAYAIRWLELGGDRHRPHPDPRRGAGVARA